MEISMNWLSDWQQGLTAHEVTRTVYVTDKLANETLLIQQPLAAHIFTTR